MNNKDSKEIFTSIIVYLACNSEYSERNQKALNDIKILIDKVEE